MPRALTLLALLLAATLGCSTKRTVKAYPGPDLPPTDIATVTVADPPMFSDEAQTLYIVAVDAVTVAEKPLIREQIVGALVKPGQHSVTFGFYDANAQSTTPATLVFEAEAGKTYELHAAQAGSLGEKFVAALTTRGKWVGWMTERPSGRVVAGSPPR